MNEVRADLLQSGFELPRVDCRAAGGRSAIECFKSAEYVAVACEISFDRTGIRGLLEPGGQTLQRKCDGGLRERLAAAQVVDRHIRNRPILRPSGEYLGQIVLVASDDEVKPREILQ